MQLGSPFSGSCQAAQHPVQLHFRPRDKNDSYSVPALTEKLQETKVKLKQRSMLSSFADNLLVTWSFSAALLSSKVFWQKLCREKPCDPAG